MCQKTRQITNFKQMKAVALVLIRFYQLVISPLFPASCRFVPTCSEYAKESVLRFGAYKGSVLTFRRIIRCHPWGGSGLDPVPEKEVQEPNNQI